MIEGHASPRGTSSLKDKVEGLKTVKNHFRLTSRLWLSSLGMGTYLGNTTSEDDRLMTEAVITSVNSGIVNVIDTAINYRFQKSERCIGSALTELITKNKTMNRDQVFISTKQGYIPGDADQALNRKQYIAKLINESIINSKDVIQGMHCMTVPFLRHQLETSLENLNLSTIDLLYLHNPGESALPYLGKKEFFKRLEEAFHFYEEMRDEKKILYYGIATWDSFRSSPSSKSYLSLEELVEVAKSIKGSENHGFKFVQAPHNLAMPEILINETQVIQGKECTLLEAAKQLNVNVFCSVPLFQGRLLSPQVEKLPVPSLNTAAQKAIQFVRSTPGVLAPLVGHKHPRHVQENLKVGTVPPLSPDVFKKVYFRH